MVAIFSLADVGNISALGLRHVINLAALFAVCYLLYRVISFRTRTVAQGRIVMTTVVCVVTLSTSILVVRMLLFVDDSHFVSDSPFPENYNAVFGMSILIGLILSIFPLTILSR
jgi:hypothetical protein